MLRDLTDSFSSSVGIKQDNSGLTPSEKQELRDARKAVLSKQKQQNKQLILLFQIVYLKVEHSLQILCRLFSKKNQHCKRVAFRKVRIIATNKRAGGSKKADMVLAKLKHSVGVIVSVATTRQNMLKSVAFNRICWEGQITGKERKQSSSDLLRFRQSNSVKSSPYIKQISRYGQRDQLKYKNHNGVSASVLPKKISEKRKQEMIEENKALRKKLAMTKAPAKTFYHQMDQLLNEHQQYLKM